MICCCLLGPAGATPATILASMTRARPIKQQKTTRQAHCIRCHTMCSLLVSFAGLHLNDPGEDCIPWCTRGTLASALVRTQEIGPQPAPSQLIGFRRESGVAILSHPELDHIQDHEYTSRASAQGEQLQLHSAIYLIKKAARARPLKKMAQGCLAVRPGRDSDGPCTQAAAVTLWGQ